MNLTVHVNESKKFFTIQLQLEILFIFLTVYKNAFFVAQIVLNFIDCDTYFDSSNTFTILSKVRIRGLYKKSRSLLKETGNDVC